MRQYLFDWNNLIFISVIVLTLIGLVFAFVFDQGPKAVVNGGVSFLLAGIAGLVSLQIVPLLAMAIGCAIAVFALTSSILTRRIRRERFSGVH